MRTGIVAFLFGVWLLQQLDTLPTGNAWLVLLPSLYLLTRRGLRLPAAALCGFAWAWLSAADVLSENLPSDLIGHDVVAEGIIDEIPRRQGRITRFTFEIRTLVPADHAQDTTSTLAPGTRLSLAWYGNPPTIGAGQLWHLRLRLKPPHGMINPGGFDYEKWLFSRRIRATGYVRTDTANAMLAPIVPGARLQHWRQQVSSDLDEHLPKLRHGGILRALAIGERSGITAQDWDLLRATGTNHLVAISGLHISLIAGLTFLLASRAWPLSARLAQWIAAPRVAAAAAILAGLLYAALAGFSLPTQRAFAMLAIAFAGLLLGRDVAPSRTLALALLAVLIIDPMGVLSVGLWLSFGAVAAILMAATGTLGRTGVAHSFGRVQGAVLLGLAPLLILFFGQVSLLAPLANAVAIPVVSMLVVPCALLGAATVSASTVLAGHLFALGDQVLAWLWMALELLTRSPVQLWTPVKPTTAVFLSGCAGTVLLLLPRRLPGRWLGAVLWIPLFVAKPPAPSHGEVWLTLLDVGQGLAAVARTRRHTLVYDTGPRFGNNLDGARTAILPFLRDAGVKAIDALVVSHGDIDHAGGVRSLNEAISSRRIYHGASAAPLAGSGAIFCHEGERWTWDGVEFEFLHPPKTYTYSDNNGSCVLRIRGQGGTVLLPGDIEAPVERLLVGRYGEDLKANVLVVPHHGSSTSSTAGFVTRVRPDIALVPAGYHNRFDFPRPDVIARLESVKATVRGTADAGAIEVRVSSSGVVDGPRSHRMERLRYWHRRPPAWIPRTGAGR